MYKIDIIEELLSEFLEYLEAKTNVPFISFHNHPFIEINENYKYSIHNEANRKLNIPKWSKYKFGSGKILNSLKNAIEIKGNNLLDWHDRYGPNTKIHYRIDGILENPNELATFEEYTYRFFIEQFSHEEYFDYLVKMLGGRYPLIAYVFFLKDRDSYLPIAPKYFDKFFSLIGIDFTTSYKCSWDNYVQYNYLLECIKKDLGGVLSIDVSMLDAHTFCWIVISNIKDEILKGTWKPKNQEKYRESVTKSRRGQKQFRSGLLKKNNNMSSFGEYLPECLLIASHIKPWRDCTLSEAIDPNNGLLLTPNYDALFDSGLLSFAHSGEMIISKNIDEKSLKILGIDITKKIYLFSEETKKYLSFHREKIFET